jgi:hypothetical protein
VASEQIIRQFVAQSGCHGIDGGSVDNLDLYTDLVIEECIKSAQNKFSKKDLKQKIADGINARFGPKSTRP